MNRKSKVEGSDMHYALLEAHSVHSCCVINKYDPETSVCALQAVFSLLCSGSWVGSWSSSMRRVVCVQTRVPNVCSSLATENAAGTPFAYSSCTRRLLVQDEYANGVPVAFSSAIKEHADEVQRFLKGTASAGRRGLFSQAFSQA